MTAVSARWLSLAPAALVPDSTRLWLLASIYPAHSGSHELQPMLPGHHTLLLHNAISSSSSSNNNNHHHTTSLLPIPHPRNPRLAHLPLQLEDAIHQRLARRRAARHVDIDGHDAVAAAHDAVAVVVVAAAVGARAHGDDPARLGHLIVDLAQRGRHLVGQGAGDNHDVRLPRRGAEDDAHAVLVVARGGEVHHLDGAAG